MVAVHKVDNKDIVEAVMLCEGDKGFALYDEISDIVGLATNRISERVDDIVDLTKLTVSYEGYSRTAIRLPKDWP